MRWLLHGKLDPAVAEALRRHDHQAVPRSELDLAPDASPLEILKAAAARQLDVITADPALPRATFENDFWFARSIVLLLIEGEVEQDDAVDRLFKRYPRPAARRLYTVTGGRVKIRQLPGRA